MQIAGQGLSPEQLYTSGKCSTFFASTAAHGSVERNAKIKWSATYLPLGRGHHAAQQQHRRRHPLGDEGPEGRRNTTASPTFLAFVASPDLQVWWHKVTGYVPITNKAYELAKKEGYYTTNPTREIAILQLNRGTPTANSQGFHFGNYTQIDVRAARGAGGGVGQQEDAAGSARRRGAPRQRDPAAVREAECRQVLSVAAELPATSPGRRQAASGWRGVARQA